jgi:2-oxoglutarate/2-oxoacid ferredoxin oxidoreductase subunit alpha
LEGKFRHMATGEPCPGSRTGRITIARERVINDFSINVATVNGSGSQSANSVLLKSIFGMGVPVSGKNLFPSNIAGLPTWYTIRASKDNYVARTRGAEVLVALNPDTAKQDVMALPVGGVAIYEEKLNLKQYRDDVVFYPVPFDTITAAMCPEAKLRKLVRNMVYVGAVAQILSIDLSRRGERAAQAVCEEAEGFRFELRRGQGRVRLCGGEASQAGPVLH